MLGVEAPMIAADTSASNATLVMRGRVIVDLRNVYDRAEAEEAGFEYYGLGRGRIGGNGTHLKLVSNGDAGVKAAS